MQTVQNMSFTEAIAQGFRKSFDFTGRARRTEYWYCTPGTIGPNKYGEDPKYIEKTEEPTTEEPTIAPRRNL